MWTVRRDVKRKFEAERSDVTTRHRPHDAVDYARLPAATCFSSLLALPRCRARVHRSAGRPAAQWERSGAGDPIVGVALREARSAMRYVSARARARGVWGTRRDRKNPAEEQPRQQQLAARDNRPRFVNARKCTIRGFPRILSTRHLALNAIV